VDSSDASSDAAIEAKVSDHGWTLEEIVGLVEARAPSYSEVVSAEGSAAPGTSDAS